MTITQTVEVFYSFRSPYCYLLTSRLLALQETFGVSITIRPVYPIAIRDPEFFKRTNKLYRSYHLKDSQRLAEYLKIPYRRPIPDPIIQDLETGHIEQKQPYIRNLTRMAQASSDEGYGLKFASAVMSLIWDGRTDNWHKGEAIESTCNAVGINYDTLNNKIRQNADLYEAKIKTNQSAQLSAGHWGVPLMVFNKEAFYGQDRFEMLCWRLEEKKLKTY